MRRFGGAQGGKKSRSGNENNNLQKICSDTSKLSVEQIKGVSTQVSDIEIIVDLMAEKESFTMSWSCTSQDQPSLKHSLCLRLAHFEGQYYLLQDRIGSIFVRGTTALLVDDENFIPSIPSCISSVCAHVYASSCNISILLYSCPWDILLAENGQTIRQSILSTSKTRLLCNCWI